MLLQETQRVPDAIVSISNQLFNAFFPLAIFATYVYAGNVMTVSTTLLATKMVDWIKGPVNRMTNYYNAIIDIQVSL